MASPDRMFNRKRHHFLKENQHIAPLVKAVYIENPRRRSASMDSVNNTRDSNKCCPCSIVDNRCSSHDCACVINGKLCSERCESSQLKGDCMNQVVTRCYCIKQLNPGKGKPEFFFCNTSRCECVHLGDGCTSDCACHRECENKLSRYSQAKTERAQKCKCSSGKKSCLKAKCPCRSGMGSCSTACKCLCSCSNTPDFVVSRLARSYFKNPDQEGSAMVVVFSGLNYLYRMEFISSDKEKQPHPEEQFYETIVTSVRKFCNIPIEDVSIYLSRSPCFHQDCEPKCEVLEQCDAHRACAKHLRAAFLHIKDNLKNGQVTMSVKFLHPYVKRGDLYTKQGITCMMEGGISVEPISLREWADLLQDDIESHTSSVLTSWTSLQMDRWIFLSQNYINQCRRQLGLADRYWTSNFHEMLKATILTYGQTQHSLDILARKLQQVDQPWLMATIDETNQMSIMDRSLTRTGSGNNSPKNKGRLMKSGSKSQMADSHFELAHLGGCTLPGGYDGSMEASLFYVLENTGAYGPKLEKMLSSFTSRAMADGERRVIRSEINQSLDQVRKDIGGLLEILEKYSTRLPLMKQEVKPSNSNPLVTESNSSPILPVSISTHRQSYPLPKASLGSLGGATPPIPAKPPSITSARASVISSHEIHDIDSDAEAQANSVHSDDVKMRI